MTRHPKEKKKKGGKRGDEGRGGRGGGESCLCVHVWWCNGHVGLVIFLPFSLSQQVQTYMSMDDLSMRQSRRRDSPSSRSHPSSSFLPPLSFSFTVPVPVPEKRARCLMGAAARLVNHVALTASLLHKYTHPPHPNARMIDDNPAVHPPSPPRLSNEIKYLPDGVFFSATAPFTLTIHVLRKNKKTVGGSHSSFFFFVLLNGATHWPCFGPSDDVKKRRDKDVKRGVGDEQ